MTLARTLATALALGGVVAFPAGLALTGPAAAQATDAPVIAPAGEVSESELTAFAEATLSLAEVRDSYVARIQEAANEDEQNALVEEGNAAMLGVLEETPGISMERYFEINEAAQADPALNERIVMILQQMSGEG